MLLSPVLGAVLLCERLGKRDSDSWLRASAPHWWMMLVQEFEILERVEQRLRLATELAGSSIVAAAKLVLMLPCHKLGNGEQWKLLCELRWNAVLLSSILSECQLSL